MRKGRDEGFGGIGGDGGGGVGQWGGEGRGGLACRGQWADGKGVGIGHAVRG
jgi:hypothetical protein